MHALNNAAQLIHKEHGQHFFHAAALAQHTADARLSCMVHQLKECAHRGILEKQERLVCTRYKATGSYYRCLQLIRQAVSQLIQNVKLPWIRRRLDLEGQQLAALELVNVVLIDVSVRSGDLTRERHTFIHVLCQKH